MATREFEAILRHQSASVIIDLFGEVDAAAEPALNMAYTAAEQEQSRAIILNFRGVGYINSTGIALIVGLLARAQKAHCRLLVFGLSAHYTELFHITRLSDFLSIFPDESSALAESSAITQ
ncbi:MAG: STAS domain-containing protein [Aggregatilineales bacterium]